MFFGRRTCSDAEINVTNRFSAKNCMFLVQRNVFQLFLVAKLSRFEDKHSMDFGATETGGAGGPGGAGGRVEMGREIGRWIFKMMVLRGYS